MKDFDHAGVRMSVHDGVFFPTETTRLILDYLLSRKDYASKRILDLGCGCGVISVVLAAKGLVGPFCASDVSEAATANTLANVEKHALSAEIRTGPLYEPWKNETFDLIICDVSGISEELAKISTWFNGSADCQSGRDGTRLVSRIIRETPAHLNPTGALVLPILTLSNHEKLLAQLRETFKTADQVDAKQFYLPREVAAHRRLIETLNREGSIAVEEKFGVLLWQTLLFEARN